METCSQFFGLIGFLATVCYSVKITSIKVPDIYTIDEPNNSELLKLECEYDVSHNETGFVLKWLLNDQPIYQWIPTKKPFPLSFFKNHVDISYVASKDRFHKHSSLVITNPLANMTGEYTCSVATFQSTDKRSASLQIIVPESDFQLTQAAGDDGMVNVKCTVSDVYPKPNLAIFVHDNQPPVKMLDHAKTEAGLFNANVVSEIPKDQIDSPTSINCILSLPGTNYTKKRETIFYDQTTTTTAPDHKEISGAVSRLEAEYGNQNNFFNNHATGASSPRSSVSLHLLVATLFTSVIIAASSTCSCISNHYQ